MTLLYGQVSISRITSFIDIFNEKSSICAAEFERIIETQGDTEIDVTIKIPEKIRLCSLKHSKEFNENNLRMADANNFHQIFHSSSNERSNRIICTTTLNDNLLKFQYSIPELTRRFRTIHGSNESHDVPLLMTFSCST